MWIPPGQKHWHGASPTTSMSHVAISEQLDGKSVEWMEKVTDEQYGAALRPRPAAAAAPADQPSRAQQLMGDFAPKLAQLTDDVLYADVWARPQLSPRDRSLVTVSALVAMNRPDQLRSHLALARTNGVTEDEIAEAITHLAFYAGWPSAVTAVTVAKEVFGKSGKTSALKHRRDARLRVESQRSSMSADRPCSPSSRLRASSGWPGAWRRRPSRI